MIFEPLAKEPETVVACSNATPVTVAPSPIWRPWALTAAGVSPVLTIEKPPTPAVIPAISLLAPLF